MGGRMLTCAILTQTLCNSNTFKTYMLSVYCESLGAIGPVVVEIEPEWGWGMDGGWGWGMGDEKSTSAILTQTLWNSNTFKTTMIRVYCESLGGIDPVVVENESWKYGGWGWGMEDGGWGMGDGGWKSTSAILTQTRSNSNTIKTTVIRVYCESLREIRRAVIENDSRKYGGWGWGMGDGGWGMGDAKVNFCNTYSNTFKLWYIWDTCTETLPWKFGRNRSSGCRYWLVQSENCHFFRTLLVLTSHMLTQRTRALHH